MEILAYAAAEQGGLLHPIRYAAPSLGPHAVLIAVTHCGICHSDLHMVDNDWLNSKYPLVPGHEVIGEVAECGSQVSHLHVGQRVGLGWQVSSCGTCEWCESGQENLCADSEGTIVGRHGGFATHVVAEAKFVFPIPDGLDSAKAAPLLCGGITVYSPMKRFGLRPGVRAGVMGIGGLGHMGLQFARSMGAHVTALSSSPTKADEAAAFGANEFILVNDPGAIKAASQSLDFLLVTATVDLDWRPFIQMLRKNGTICFVTGEDTQVTVPVSLLLGRQISVTGSIIGGIATMQEMLQFSDAHGIGAKVEVMPMREVNAALTKVRRNQARFRMVLENGG
jgi:alcohol/geraniol dehydrogenase (NADP+)